VLRSIDGAPTDLWELPPSAPRRPLPPAPPRLDPGLTDAPGRATPGPTPLAPRGATPGPGGPRLSRPNVAATRDSAPTCGCSDAR